MRAADSQRRGGLNTAAGSIDCKTRCLLILLLAVFIQHHDLHFVLSLRPSVRRRREIESSCAAAGQIQRRFEAWDRSALFARDILESESTLHFHLAGGIRNSRDGVDSVARVE